MKQKKILRAVKSFQQFTSKHGMKIAMLAPLFAFFIFFSYSTISALITVKSVKIPTNFKKIKFEIENYLLEHIDQATNAKLWKLKPSSALVNSKYNKADIEDAFIEYYNKDSGEIEFIIRSNKAVIDKKTQDFKLSENVRLNYTDDKYILNSGNLSFSDNSDVFEVGDSWNLKVPENGILISGQEGNINKNFKSIDSIGEAKLEQGNYDLSAEKISIKSENGKQTVSARGNSFLKISDKNINLKASQIHLDAAGNLRAEGNVSVVTDKINCFANKLCVRQDELGQIGTLTGNPHILRNGDTIFADEIIYNFETEELTIKGHVHS